VIAEFESGNGRAPNALDRRPKLRTALAHAPFHKATLVIAKLDRLPARSMFSLWPDRAEVPIVWR